MNEAAAGLFGGSVSCSFRERFRWLVAGAKKQFHFTYLLPPTSPNLRTKSLPEIMRTTACIVLLFPLLFSNEIVSAFFTPTPSTTQHQKARYVSRQFGLQSTASSEATEKSTKVTRVSVCMGELCQCQGEEYEYTGGAADAALQKLQGLDLPFPIDEVGCMGVCGMGTMIAIDYENGDSVMTDGLAGAINELGLKMEVSDTVSQSAAVDDNLLNRDVPVESKANASEVQKGENVPTKSRELTDVRERMREAARQDADQGNPWMNMASYLAKKAVDNVLGGE